MFSHVSHVSHVQYTSLVVEIGHQALHPTRNTTACHRVQIRSSFWSLNATRHVSDSVSQNHSFNLNLNLPRITTQNALLPQKLTSLCLTPPPSHKANKKKGTVVRTKLKPEKATHRGVVVTRYIEFAAFCISVASTPRRISHV